MKRIFALSLVAVLAACGGGEPDVDEAPAETDAEPAAQPAQPPAAASGPTGEMTRPSWFQVDSASQTVNITLTAGATPQANYWNFNGAVNGNMAITVPEGFTVNLTLVNEDPNMAHSVGVEEEVGGFSAAPQPTPAFEGAVTPNPTSMVDGTMPGEEATITFTAGTAGNYSLVCYIPGHAATGMWIRFNVSSDGSMGVQGAQM